MQSYAGGRLAFALKSMVDPLWIRSDHQRSTCTKAGTVQRRFACLCSRMAGKPIEWSSVVLDGAFESLEWSLTTPRSQVSLPISHNSPRGKRAVSVGRDGAHLHYKVSVHPADSERGLIRGLPLASDITNQPVHHPTVHGAFK